MIRPLYREPVGMTDGGPNGAGPLFLGGPERFTAVREWRRGANGGAATEIKPSLPDDAGLAPSLAPFAGLSLDNPVVMGVINVTPDSFSDGGDHFDLEAAVAAGRRMLDAGAAILDVGGESTRPGAGDVSIAEEIDRVVPVISALSGSGAAISIDTRRAPVAEAALAAGAAIVNDVTALTHDPDLLNLVADTGAPVILMHMQGEPRTMQDDPRYDVAPLDIYDYLAQRIDACAAAGIARGRIAVDPGIGFGKTVAHNLEILRHLSLLTALGCPVAIGVSRKSSIGKLSRNEPAKERLPGSLAAALAAVRRGARIVRVHDVAETCQALAIDRAIAGATD